MAIMIPSWLHWLSWVAGSDWPEGNEDEQKAAGEDIKRQADELRTRVHGVVETAIKSTLAAYPAGDGRTEMDQSLKKELADLDDLANYYAEAGQRSIDSAAAMRSSKINGILSLAWLAAELAYAALLGPGAPFAQAGAIGATQVAFRWLGGRLLMAIEGILARTALSQASRHFLAKVMYEITQEALTEVLQGSIQEVTVQSLLINDGYQTNLDWHAIGQNAWISGVAGGVGGGAGFGLNNTVRRLPGGDSRFAAMYKGSIVGAGAGLAGAGAAYLSSGLSGGGWEFDPRMFTGGAASGVGPSMIHGYRGGSNYAGGPMGNGPGLSPDVSALPTDSNNPAHSQAGDGSGAGDGSSTGIKNGASVGAGSAAGTGTSGASTSTGANDAGMDAAPGTRAAAVDPGSTEGESPNSSPNTNSARASSGSPGVAEGTNSTSDVEAAPQSDRGQGGISTAPVGLAGSTDASTNEPTGAAGTDAAGLPDARPDQSTFGGAQSPHGSLDTSDTELASNPAAGSHTASSSSTTHTVDGAAQVTVAGEAVTTASRGTATGTVSSASSPSAAPSSSSTTPPATSTGGPSSGVANPSARPADSAVGPDRARTAMPQSDTRSESSVRAGERNAGDPPKASKLDVDAAHAPSRPRAGAAESVVGKAPGLAAVQAQTVGSEAPSEIGDTDAGRAEQELPDAPATSDDGAVLLAPSVALPAEMSSDSPRSDTGRTHRPAAHHGEVRTSIGDEIQSRRETRSSTCVADALRWIRQLTGNADVRVPDSDIGPRGMTASELESYAGGHLQAFGADTRLSDPHDEIATLLHEHGAGSSVLVVDLYRGPADEHDIGAHTYVLSNDNGLLTVRDDSHGEPHLYPPRNPGRELAGTWGIFYDASGTPIHPADGPRTVATDQTLPWHRIGALPDEPGYLVSLRDRSTGLPIDVQIVQADRDFVDSAEAALAALLGPTADTKSLMRDSDPDDLSASARHRAETNAQWWHALSRHERRSLVVTHPGIIGNADGIPAAVRDEANRLSIRRDLDALTWRLDSHYRLNQHHLQLLMSGTTLSAKEKSELRNLLHTQRALLRADQLAAAVHPDVDKPNVHVLSYSATEFGGIGRAVVSFGDVDVAESLSWHVFGMKSSIGSLADQLKLVRNAYEMTLRTDPTVKAASIAWIGYDAPNNYRQASNTIRAEAGGKRLAQDVLALHATRAYLANQSGQTKPTSHLFGHRYGATTVSAAAADARLKDELASLTLLAAPGAGRVRHADEYGVGIEVYVASASRDWVAGMGANTTTGRGRYFNVGLGVDPAIDSFGAIRIAAEIPVDGADDAKPSALARLLPKLIGYETTPFAPGAPVHSQYYLFADEHTRQPTETLDNIGRIAANRGDTVQRAPHRAGVSNPNLWQRRIGAKSDDPESRRSIRVRDGSLPDAFAGLDPVLADTVAADADVLVREALALRGVGVHPADLMHRGLADDYLRARDVAMENALWWDSLAESASSEGELSPMQQALVTAHPFEIGNADGIPADVRDIANRLQMQRDFESLLAQQPQEGKPPNSRGSRTSALEHQKLKNIIATQEALNRSTGVRPGIPIPPVHVLSYDALAYGGEGRAVVAIGNVDTAQHVSWQIPGITTTVEMLPYCLQMARNPYEAMVRAAPTVEVASIAWIGYDAPSGKNILAEARTPEFAEVGGRILARDVMAYYAAREARAAARGASPPPMIHLFGHSYGSTTTGYGAAAGRLSREVNTITLVGSPGAGPVQNAAEFGIGTENVFVAKDAYDPVAAGGGLSPGRMERFLNKGLGLNPSTDVFGAQQIDFKFPRRGPFGRAFPAHSAYFDYVDPDIGEATESLRYFGQIATGQGDRVPRVPRRIIPTEQALRRAGWIPAATNERVGPTRQDSADTGRRRDLSVNPSERTRPEIHGNRGGVRQLAPTILEGYKQAMDLGVDVIETDIGLTRDGVPVISSDQRITGTIARDTGPVRSDDPQFPYVGKLIRTLTAEQIASLDSTSMSNALVERAAPALGRGVPTLAQAAELANGRGVALAIAVRTDPSWSDAEVRAVVQAAVECMSGYEVPYRLLGLDWRVLTFAAEIAPPSVERVALVTARTATTAWLGVDPGTTPPGWVREIVAQIVGSGRLRAGDLPAAARAAGATMISPEPGMATDVFLRQAADADLPVVPNTVNDPAEMRRLIDAGVAGIVTDYPDRLRAVLVERGYEVPDSVPPRASWEPLFAPEHGEQRPPTTGHNDAGAAEHRSNELTISATAVQRGGIEQEQSHPDSSDTRSERASNDQFRMASNIDDSGTLRITFDDVGGESPVVSATGDAGGRGPIVPNAPGTMPNPDDSRPGRRAEVLPVDGVVSENERELAKEALDRRSPRATPERLLHSDYADADTTASARDRAESNARWWHAMNAAGVADTLVGPDGVPQLSELQAAVCRTHPQVLGNADGVPVVVRDYANRLAIGRELSAMRGRNVRKMSKLEQQQLRNLESLVVALADADRMAREVGVRPGLASPEVHVISYDATAFGGKGRAVVAFGDMDTADSVSFHVPGVKTNMQTLAWNLDFARNHFEVTALRAPHLRVASIAWLGYDAPASRVGGIRRSQAIAGGALLARDITAFNATREVRAQRVDGARSPRVHVFGHNYGSTTTSYTGAGARLAGEVDTITLAGSPGVVTDHASEFGSGVEIFVASASSDNVTWIGTNRTSRWSRYFGLGIDPSVEAFGARRIASEYPRTPEFADQRRHHTRYYDYTDAARTRPTEALENLGRIAAGLGDTVAPEQHRPGTTDANRLRRVLRGIPKTDPATTVGVDDGTHGHRPVNGPVSRPNGPEVHHYAGERQGWSQTTLPGLHQTMMQGVDAVQLGVGLTRDGVPVVHHEQRIDARTIRDTRPATPNDAQYPYVGKPIRELTLDQVRTLDSGAADPSASGQPRTPETRVPTLAEVCTLVNETSWNGALLVEIRTDPTWNDTDVRGLVAAAIETLEQHGVEYRITAFDWRAIAHAAELAPTRDRVALVTARTATPAWLGCDPGISKTQWARMIWAQLTGTPRDAGGNLAAAARQMGATQLSPERSMVTESLMRQAGAADVRVSVWKVNEIAEIHRLIDLGVDGVVSDHPDRVREVMTHRGRATSDMSVVLQSAGAGVHGPYPQERSSHDCAVRSMQLIRELTGSTAIDVDGAREVGLNGMNWHDLEAHAGGRLHVTSHSVIAERLRRMGVGATALVIDEYHGIAQRSQGVGAHAYVMSNADGIIMVLDAVTDQVFPYQDWTPPLGVDGTWAIHYDSDGIPQRMTGLERDDGTRPGSLIGEPVPPSAARVARARAEWTAVEQAVRDKGQAVRYERDAQAFNSRADELRRFLERTGATDERGRRKVAAVGGLPTDSSGVDFSQSSDAKLALPVRRRSGETERFNEQIGRGLTERHGIDVYGFGLPGVDTGTVREIVTALDDMLAEYPHTRILSVEISDVDGDIAQALEDRLPHADLKATRIAFSKKYATDPVLLSRDVSEAVQGGHFFPRPGGPAYSTIVHEFGHALTYAGRSAAVGSADSHLFAHYLQKYGHANPGIDISESYRIWRGQLSGYSFWKGDFHPTEALAEAFTDVSLNRDRASEPAQVLHKMLVETAEAEWRKEGLI